MGEPSPDVLRDEGWRGARKPPSLGDGGNLKLAPQPPARALALSFLLALKLLILGGSYSALIVG